MGMREQPGAEGRQGERLEHCWEIDCVESHERVSKNNIRWSRLQLGIPLNILPYDLYINWPN